jgi:hypothetical protein
LIPQNQYFRHKTKVSNTPTKFPHSLKFCNHSQTSPVRPAPPPPQQQQQQKNVQDLQIGDLEILTGIKKRTHPQTKNPPKKKKNIQRKFEP